jgi:hypothetical protein
LCLLTTKSKSLFPFRHTFWVYPEGSNFPEKTSVFPAGQKIGTIFCPKGGLAVVPLNNLMEEGKINFF